MTTATTTSPLVELARRLAQHGLILDKAVPRSAEHLLVQLTRPADGTSLAGQWYADPERAAAVAQETDRAATRDGRPGLVRLIDDHVITQYDGADRKLTALAGLLSRETATLVAHRPERRAVVRHRGDAGAQVFTKVVRPGRAAPIARTLAQLAAGNGSGSGDRARLRLPRAVGVDDAHGTVTTTALPGRPLHELWTLPGAAHATTGAMSLTGQTLATLHTQPRPPWTGRHSRDDELTLTRRWLDLAEGHGVLPLPRVALDRLLRRAAVLIPGPGDDQPRAVVPVHRDLHDKQVLVHESGVGLIDLDLLAAGDPALDVANLLVHVELRTRQALTTPTQARSCRDAFLEAYGWWDAAADRALAGYALTARLRLLAVYAFRPCSTAAAVELVTHPLFEEMA